MTTQVEESNVVRLQNGRKMMSAQVVIAKAQELARSSGSVDKKGRPVVKREHLNAAKHHLLGEDVETQELTDIEKEQKAIFDKQMEDFQKDARANRDKNLKKESMDKVSFKNFIKLNEGRLDPDELDAVARNVKGYCSNGDVEMAKKHIAAKVKHPQDKAFLRNIVRKASSKPVSEEVQGAKQHENQTTDSLVVTENSPFDWKKGKSEINWKSDEKEKETSAAGGTIHKARTTARNAETGGAKDKQSVGRPKGEYGSYKIDPAKREDPEYKKKLSQKVMAAKMDNFKDRDQWKKDMHRAIMRKQLETAGINPDDHTAAIEKKLPKSKV